MPTAASLFSHFFREHCHGRFPPHVAVEDAYFFSGLELARSGESKPGLLTTSARIPHARICWPLSPLLMSWRSSAGSHENPNSFLGNYQRALDPDRARDEVGQQSGLVEADPERVLGSMAGALCQTAAAREDRSRLRRPAMPIRAATELADKDSFRRYGPSPLGDRCRHSPPSC